LEIPVASSDIKETLEYVAVTIVTLSGLQAVLIVMHEFTHSTTAWVLGFMPHPFSIVWGNFVTMKGWDEGVPYDRIFPSPQNPAEALIGASPLAAHTIVVTVGLVLLQRQWTTRNKWSFHILYWFVIVNLMELISYVVMRPFSPGGDTGHFNRGLGLSPWILFVAGTLAIIFGLYVLFGKVIPIMDHVIAKGNRLTESAILLVSAFIVFLWGSGMRVMSMYPDPQWTFGLIGAAAFGIVLFTCNPYRHAGR
jgi:hypothetical protein